MDVDINYAGDAIKKYLQHPTNSSSTKPLVERLSNVPYVGHLINPLTRTYRKGETSIKINVYMLLFCEGV
jgi:hypothetical protein